MIARIAVGLVVGLAIGWLLGAPEKVLVPLRAGPEQRATGVESHAVALAEANAPLVEHESESRRELAAPARAFDGDRGVIVHGRVVDGAGELLPNWALRIEQSDGRMFLAEVDDRAVFAVVGVAPGAIRLSGKRDGFADIELAVDVPAVHAFEVDVVLTRTPTLPVHFVRPDGSPWPYGPTESELGGQLGVLAFREPPPPVVWSQSRRRAEFGELSRFDPDDELAGAGAALERPCHGLLTLTAPPPLFVALLYRNSVVESRPLVGDERELVFVFDEARLARLDSTVRVRMVERATGEPIAAGVRLRFQATADEVNGDYADGVHTWSNVPPGLYELERGGGHELEMWEELVRVGPAEEIDLGVRELDALGEFEVHVHAPDGTPLDVQLSFQRLEADGSQRHRYTLGADNESDRPGVCVMRFLPLGDTLIRTSRSDQHALVALRVDTRKERVVTLVVPPAELVELVPRGRVRSQARLRLENADGLALDNAVVLPKRLRLAPGTYRVREFDGANELGESSFVVEPGATRVEIEVTR